MNMLRVAAVLCLVVLPFLSLRAEPDGPDSGRILLNAGSVDPASETPAALRQTARSIGGKRLHLVQFAGPVQPEWVEELRASGVRIVSYIPHNAYLVYGDAASRAAVGSLRSSRKHVRWDGAYLDADKIQPRAKAEGAKSRKAPAGDQYAIQLVDDAVANAASLAVIDQFKLAPASRIRRANGYLNIVVRLPAGAMPAIASLPEVVSIDAYVTPKKFDERQDIIVSGQLSGNVPSAPGYLTWLADRGFTQSQFTASAFAVDVTDSGVDNGTNSPNHFALYVNGDTGQASRIAYNRLEGTPNTGSTIQGCDGHGNINAHIVGGYVGTTNSPHADSAGYRYGLGVCPFVRIGSSVIFDPANFTSPDYSDLASRAYRDGARISGNSWGADTAGGYDIDAQEYDALVRDAQPAGAAVSSNGNQQMTFVFAAGNAGSGAQTVGSPGTAKNVITAGAAENVHSHATTNGGNNATGNDGCTTPDTEANSANDVATFSSRGPCSDQRRKPEIQAPGTHITGGVAQGIKTMSGTGTPLACFSGEGVCALPGGGTVGSTNNYFPRTQRFYTTSSGTSHSTPAVAGGCALIYQHFLNLGLNAPSPAMIKSYLLNSARYMTGASANDSLWSNSQGMGMMNLGFAFDGTQRILRDQTTNDLFTASGQSRVFTVAVVSNAKPLRVTLSWTDAPGSTSGNAFNNDLNLVVQHGGKTYLGNVFNGSDSTNGGTADFRNNSESVFLPAGTTGTVVVTVSAANIVSDGVPNFGGSLDQDFALVIYNAVEVQVPAIVGAGSTITAESCGVGNGSVDPDETVTVNFALRNAGTAPTTNVVATLQATGGVTAPSGAQSYGALAAGGATVTNAFTFTATGTCGSVVTATLALLDGATDLGSVTYSFTLGSQSLTVTTNSNTGTITVPDSGTASPYPSSITVSNMAGSISKVTVTLSGFAHTYPSDLDVLLVGPGGENCVLMSGAGADVSVSGLTLTFDDDAAAAVPSGALSTGTYRPGDYGPAALANPAPSAPYGTTLSGFAGTSPNGVWKLYIFDAFAGDSGSVALGWKLALTVGEPLCCASNQPPILTTIGSKSVVQSNTLTFSVAATDPFDGDPVTLSASNLPSGATFPTVTNTASVTNTFLWTNALPVGVYTATFYAVDKDGADQEAVLITVSDGSCVPSNVLNESFDASTNLPAGWVNGGSALDTVSSHYQSAPNCRAMGVGDTLDTPSVNYPTQLVFYVDASSSGGQTGTVAYSIGGGGFTTFATFTATTAGSNQTYALTASPDLSGTAGVQFRFTSAANTWYLDDVRVVGGCPGAPPAQTHPQLGTIGNKSVTVSNTLQFAVTATPTDGDAVTLSVSNAPAEALFSATNENGTFVWTNAGPVGVYTTTFYAVDNDGSTSETITISVTPPGTEGTNVLALYTFDTISSNFTLSANTVLSGLSAGTFASGDGGVTNATGNPGNAAIDSAFIGTTNNYFAFTLTIAGTNPLSVKKVSFDDRRSSTGPSLWALRSSVDGFASDLGSGGTHLSFAANEVALDLNGITGSVTFRVYGQNGSAGTWRLDNVGAIGALGGSGGSDLASVVITTAGQVVSNPIATMNVGGTANTNTVGLLIWTNALTGGAGTIAAATNWLISAIPLNVGTNVITVSGTNAAGFAASDSVAITRQAGGGGGGGCSNILFQGFEAGDNWTIAAGSNGISSAIGAGDTPPSQRVRTGVNSWQLNNASNTLDLAQTSIAGYTGRQVSVRLSSTSTNATNGADAPDAVRVYVALDGAAFSSTPDILVTGSNNVRYGYWATNRVTTTAGVPVSATAPIGNTTTSNAFASLLVTLPESATAAALRVIANNNAGQEYWNIDDIALTGCPTSAPPDLTPLLVITTANQTVAFSVTNTSVGGASSNLVGLIAWTNGLNGSSGTIAAADPWLIAGIPLAVGTNAITMSGSNSLGVVTGATVSIAREGPDTDGDGMDDAWELFFFGSLTNATATSDFDGDNFIDFHEFRAGTVPTNGNSLLIATMVTNAPANNTVVVQWQSATSKVYGVKRLTDLVPGGWLSITSGVAATPPLNTVTDAAATNTTHIYRIDLE